MIAKKEITLEFQTNDNLYRFSMPEGAPIGEIYDVGFQIIKKASDMAAAAVQDVARQLQPPVSPSEIGIPLDCIPVTNENLNSTSTSESGGA
jgi:hypothetical protein